MTEEASNPHSLAFVEEQYLLWRTDPHAVSPRWRAYFEGVERGADGDGANGAFRLQPSFAPAARGGNGRDADAPDRPAPPAPQIAPPATTPAATPRELPEVTVERQSEMPERTGVAPGSGGITDVQTRAALELLQERVDQLIRSYRTRGHMFARIDPLGQRQPKGRPLEPESLGLTEADLDQPFSTNTLAGPEVQTLREIIDRLRNTYCRSIGVQFMHITNFDIRTWLQERMESTENRLGMSRRAQLRILKRLTDAVVFEQFLQTKYIGAKTFSLEGAETLIPLLDLAIEKAGAQGISEIVIGMAHRGRLNVLNNIMGKSPQHIFREFEDVDPEMYLGGGDVKYHLGYSNDWQTSDGHKLHLSLCFNPSHLEYIGPVALGRMRAKQDRARDTARERGMVLLIHGDAAFAGEGVVQETLNLSQLRGYSTGGTLHVILNNQIGFTTLPEDARTSDYCTDVAKMLDIPIFHVNGEDPEAVAQTVDLAMDFRKKFKRDAIIDMFCYRRHGHNEGDEPNFTQPKMYQIIEQRPSVRQSYLKKMKQMGGVTDEEADRFVTQREAELERALEEARGMDFPPQQKPLAGVWSGYVGGPEQTARDVETGVPKEKLIELLQSITHIPEGCTPNAKILRGMERRQEMAKGERPLDWAAAEALAFASLATEALRIRLSGQDSQRGTFSQRHAILHHAESGREYHTLAHLSPAQAPVEIYNSPLSEAGVLGFDYGYSLDCPDGLVLWEAQFGDFANAAQVIIDQFISSAEDKWRRLSGIVMLLPHGFEGQGPEHSSARLERFMVLAAEDNIQVTVPTTPGQYFHALRRQVIRPWRKPLVVMTPKGLLRHPEAVSSLDELTSGTSRRVIPDDKADPADVSRVLLCTGKVYYDLRKRRKELKRKGVAIIRIEQLYPFPTDELRAALAPFADGTLVVWVQEEPQNMGAWPFMWSKFGHELFGRLPFSHVTRPESASPATGSSAAHKHEQEQLVNMAFGGVDH